MGTSKTITTIFVYLIAIFGITAGAYLTTQNQNISEKAAPVPTLYINPDKLTVKQNDNFILEVMVDSPSRHINSVDIRLNFDPSIFEVTRLEEGSKTSKLDSVISEQTIIDNTLGKVSFVAFTTDKTQTVAGSKIKLFTLFAKSKNTPGNYKFNFDNQSIVTAIDEPSNIISMMSGSDIKVEGTLSVKPTVLPTTIPSPSPIVTTSPKTSWKRGDLNRDTFVNVVDIAILLDNYDLPAQVPEYDLNIDGSINIIDIGIVIDNYGS